MVPKIYIGTSGYSYDDWKEVFYPPKMQRKDFLEYYTKFLNATEVNFTYYQMPFAKTIEALIRKSEGKVQFSIKAHQSMTHERIEDNSLYEKFQVALDPLAREGVLSCILAQFPFSFKRNPQAIEFLDRFSKRMRRYPVVVEFRHSSWVNKGMLLFLKERGLGFCCVDEPKLPGLVPKVLAFSNKIGYLRFHGRNTQTWWNYTDQAERYDYLYNYRELSDWFHRLKNTPEDINELFIFFNNHPRAQAVKNAFMMKRLYGHELTVPEDLELIAQNNVITEFLNETRTASSKASEDDKDSADLKEVEDTLPEASDTEEEEENYVAPQKATRRRTKAK